MALGPAKRYEVGKNVYDTLATVFANVKQKINGNWNRPVEQLDGLTLAFVGPDKIKLSHAKYIVASPYLMTKKEKPEAEEFLNSFMVELAAAYKQAAKSAITFTKIDEQQDIQLFSKISPDRSWVYGTTSGPNVARYLVTTTRFYNISARNLPNEKGRA